MYKFAYDFIVRDGFAILKDIKAGI